MCIRDSSSSSLAHGQRHNNTSPTTSHSHNDRDSASTQHINPPLKRSSKSFLSFISRKPSMDSIRSEKSNDSTLHSPHASHSNNHHHLGASDLSGPASPKQSHSMAELKRFFRPSMNKKLSMSQLHTSTHTHHSPPPSNSASTSTLNLNAHYLHHQNDVYQHHHPHGSTDHYAHTQSAIPPSTDSILSLSNNINIYHDDSILAQKYGKLGKLLGAGAGGSVKVLVRPTDGVTFAVKEFRPRKPNESVKEYAKKCTAEFCIGSTLHHPNVIETVDIFSDSKQNKYFEVMQYCPVDFFAVVMTGKMSRGEINCCLKQLLEGVKYLHSMGLAHRDLKLDNCVMNEDGILKLIDFGSAVVFRYPYEDDIAMAHGIVGSDPYLAPEVITSTKSYDPQCVDIWSVGIIYCCMMLKRFPWKAPRESDDNFRLYSMPDDMEHDYVESARHHEELLRERKVRRQRLQGGSSKDQIDQHHADEHSLPQSSEEKKVIEQPVETPKKPEEDLIKAKAEQPQQLPTPPPSNTPNQEVDDSNAKKENETTPEPLKDDKVEAQQPEPIKDDNKGGQRPEQTTNTEAPKEKAEEHNHSTQGREQPHVNERMHVDSRNQNQDQKSIMSHKTTITQGPTQNGGPHHHKKTIHGPYRLLRLLPHASRPIMSRILEIDPKKRATLEEIFSDEWFKDIPACTMDSKNQVIRAPGHHHTVVKEENAHLATYKI